MTFFDTIYRWWEPPSRGSLVLTIVENLQHCVKNKYYALTSHLTVKLNKTNAFMLLFLL